LKKKIVFQSIDYQNEKGANWVRVRVRQRLNEEPRAFSLETVTERRVNKDAIPGRGMARFVFLFSR
jgi:hypothetical protein